MHLQVLIFQRIFIIRKNRNWLNLMSGWGLKKASMHVFVIGSGNIENILMPVEKVLLGQKHLVTTTELIGGSCINYFLRMANAGFDAYPIPLVGKDSLGAQIQAQLIQVCKELDLEKQILNFISSPDFLIPGIRTAQATIIVHEGQRTIFSKIHTASDAAREHILKRFSSLKTLPVDKASLMIGHVPLDKDPQREGVLTGRILSTAPSDWLILMNPGPSQYRLGLNKLKKELGLVDILQLNLFEIKTLFGRSGMPNTLPQIVRHLSKDAATALITLKKFGAVGIYKGNLNRVIVARPLPIQKVVDPTGAGDAYAAGVICTLNGNKAFSFNEFVAAIQTGRLWASYACTTLGASGECPNAARISNFDKCFGQGKESITVYDRTDAFDVLDTLDNID